MGKRRRQPRQRHKPNHYHPNDHGRRRRPLSCDGLEQCRRSDKPIRTPNRQHSRRRTHHHHATQSQSRSHGGIRFIHRRSQRNRPHHLPMVPREYFNPRDDLANIDPHQRPTQRCWELHRQNSEFYRHRHEPPRTTRRDKPPNLIRNSHSYRRQIAVGQPRGTHLHHPITQPNLSKPMDIWCPNHCHNKCG